MNFEKVFQLSKEELYEEAKKYRQTEDWNNYFVYLVMSANLNYKEAEKLLLKDCYYLLDRQCLFFNQDFNLTKQFYESTSEYTYSANILGCLYDLGFFEEDMKIQYEKVIKLYEYSVSLGNPFAMCNLADIYAKGYKNIIQNKDKALELYLLSLEKGNALGSASIAEIYVSERNYSEAIRYYELAIDMGYERSKKRLSDLYKKNRNAKNTEYIINYFLKINYKEALKEIYGFKNDIISIFEEKLKLEREVSILKKENEEMKNHIIASPDGDLYFELLSNWKNNIK